MSDTVSSYVEYKKPENIQLSAYETCVYWEKFCDEYYCDQYCIEEGYSHYLDWSYVPEATSYKIYKSQYPGVSTASELAFTGSSHGHEFLYSYNEYYYYYYYNDIIGLDGETCFFYRASFVDAFGVESELSQEVSASVTGGPCIEYIPQNVDVTYQTNESLNYLIWDDIADATGYHVYWGTSTGVTTGSEFLDPTTTPVYGHTGVLPGSTYCYRVAAVINGVEFDLSDEVCETVMVPAPQNVQVEYDASQDWNYVTWNDIPSGIDTTEYNVYWGISTGVSKNSTFFDPTTMTESGHTGVIPGWTYCYAVSAKINGIESELSEEVWKTIPYEGSCIVQVVASGDHTIGLKYDGTVVGVGRNDSIYNASAIDVDSWTDIVSIDAGSQLTVGLEYDGTVAAAGYFINRNLPDQH